MTAIIDASIATVFGWITLLITTLVVAHVLRFALGWVSEKFRGSNHLIAIIELVMLIVMSVIVLHEYLEPQSNAAHAPHSFTSNPLLLVVLMVVFALLSAVLYVANQELARRRDDR